MMMTRGCRPRGGNATRPALLALLPLVALTLCATPSSASGGGGGGGGEAAGPTTVLAAAAASAAARAARSSPAAVAPAPPLPRAATLSVASAAAAAAAANVARNSSTATAATAIPPLLHQSWRTRAVPPRFAPLVASWARCQPAWRRELWTDAANRALVSKHFGWLLPAYDGLPDPVMRADLARAAYMHAHGGVYADLGADCRLPAAV